MVVSDFILKGKKALIAGDSKYWSKYVAAALAQAGADVAIAGENKKKLAAAAQEAKKQGVKTLTILADVTKLTEVIDAFGQITDKFGEIDILVNAADIKFAQPFLETSKSQWDRLFDLNLTAVFNTCQVVGQAMVKRKKGRIINITSCLAERGMANCSAYCSSAGAILQLTRALALEWSREGVTVNAIGAGWMAEPGEPVDEKIARYIPYKRYGQPQEIGSTLTYLASDAASFLTAEFIYVDGAVMEVL
jgi:NAD(P)-dependent dehydrogenase (short-subunit alcohol dehydrogenase family)